jgi:hypothetical protein
VLGLEVPQLCERGDDIMLCVISELRVASLKLTAALRQ